MGIFLGTLHDLPISLSICRLVVSILSGNGYRIRMYSVCSYANLVKITCFNSILQNFFLNLIIFYPVMCSPQSFDFFFNLIKKKKMKRYSEMNISFFWGGGGHIYNIFAFHINWWCVLWFFFRGGDNVILSLRESCVLVKVMC